MQQGATRPVGRTSIECQPIRQWVSIPALAARTRSRSRRLRACAIFSPSEKSFRATSRPIRRTAGIALRSSPSLMPIRVTRSEMSCSKLLTTSIRRYSSSRSTSS